MRSGVLTSVHAFATDPTRGVFILVILCALHRRQPGAVRLARASSLKQGGLFAPISREGALVLNNLFLTTACATVFVGTLYPLALEALTGDKISVGAPFFNLTFGPLFVPLLIAVPFGPLLAWKRGDLLGAAQRLLAAGIAALVAIAVVWAWARGGSALAPLGDRACRLRHRRRADAISPSAPACSACRFAIVAAPRRAACRARPGARPSRMPASASR